MAGRTTFAFALAASDSRRAIRTTSWARDTSARRVRTAADVAPSTPALSSFDRDGTLIRHKIGPERCTGSEGTPGEPISLANWLPLRPGLTPHGLRHGHQTWLDDLGIRYVLQSERMGHEVPGMRGVYSRFPFPWLLA